MSQSPERVPIYVYVSYASDRPPSPQRTPKRQAARLGTLGNALRGAVHHTSLFRSVPR